MNVLALKSTNGEYIINGNYTVSPSGTYEITGTTIDYHRFDGNLKDTQVNSNFYSLLKFFELNAFSLNFLLFLLDKKKK
jgi:hypothetical protein